MEPLAQRLRRERSLEVDEEHPDYIREKRKAEARLKSQFENIFAKYENMPESMSDEIDMATGRIVVDRGHLRSLENSAQGWRAAQFLDDLLPEDDTPLVYNYDDNSEDELAPSVQSSLSGAPKRKQQEHQHPLSCFPSEMTNMPGLANAATTEGLPTNVTSPPLVSKELANTLSPVTAMQPTQLPQTPSNHSIQTQNAFLVGLQQAVTQAVSQYTSQALSAYLGDPTLTSLLNTPGLPASQSLADHTQASASADKWWFPTLPEQSGQPLLPQSSPIRQPVVERKRREGFAKRRRSEGTHPERSKLRKTVDVQDRVDVFSHDSPEVDQDSTTSMASNIEEDASNLVKENKRARQRRYRFKDEDDEYLRDQKRHGKTWTEIQADWPAFKELPLWTIQQHYYNCVRQFETSKASRLMGMRTSILDTQGNLSTASASPEAVEQRQLLTPTSLRQPEASNSNGDRDALEPDSPGLTRTSDAQIDKDDMELLSLASDSPPPQDIEVEEYLEAHNETIIPSIEAAHEQHRRPPSHTIVSDFQFQVSNKDCHHPTLLRGSQKEPESPKGYTSTKEVENHLTEPIVNYDSDDLGSAPLQISPLQSNTCTRCEKGFKTSRILQWHQTNRCGKDVLSTADSVPEQPAAFVENLDELELPCTPQIKLERTSPGVSALYSAPLLFTPKSAPRPVLHSSEQKSLKRLNTAERLKIRQSWAKRGRQLAVRPQRSLHLLQKRQSRDEEESADELA